MIELVQLMMCNWFIDLHSKHRWFRELKSSNHLIPRVETSNKNKSSANGKSKGDTAHRMRQVHIDGDRKKEQHMMGNNRMGWNRIMKGKHTRSVTLIASIARRNPRGEMSKRVH